MISPQPVTDLMWAHWKTRILLSAVELGVFTALAGGPLTAAGLCARTALHPGPSADFLDALVALGLLDRSGDRYAGTPEALEYLDAGKPASYLGAGLLSRSPGLADELVGVLRTGKASHGGRDGRDFYARTYATAQSAGAFQRDMTTLSIGPARALAERFPWHRYRTLVDVGCAEGAVPGWVLRSHPHLTAVGFDLPAARPGFEAYTELLGVAERVEFRPGDFFRDELPRADVVVLGHVLHNWSEPEKLRLLEKAYAALPPGGAVLVHETLIDDERRGNAVGLILSLIMHAEVPGGFDYTGAQGVRWLRQAGFRKTRVEHLDGPESMLVGIR
ncbi:methyltransferase [Streptomyces sp. GC420]|uniref:methyltransferase n=1 Tax=Streptomyces sp. GC420 TaxID=2697568 RepID=UPI00141516CD|nr:methyltransferase [Streptomyces sp. GC420]NBM18198.1 methyltransferase domain-containing protein [Streptomyces sp. GC420]